MRVRAKIFILTVIITNVLSFSMMGQDLLISTTSLDDLKSSLILDQKWVQYPNYEDRSAWDQFLGKNKTLLIRRGEAKLDYKWQLVKATDYLEYERSGNREVMQTPSSANQDALASLVLAELAEGKGRFLDQIINGVFLQCERTSWVLSAHLPAQLSKRSFPDYRDQVIDLGSVRIAGFLAWTYYFLHKEFDKIDPAISARLHKELYDKMILPYRNEDRYWWMAFNLPEDGLVNNWNPWCNFNALQCLMLLENDTNLLAKDVYKTMKSVDKFINYINADGACEEGPSYWGHAAGKLYDYLKILSLATDNRVSLFDNTLIKNMGEYMPNTYVGNDWVVNFADASAKFSSDASLIYRYGDAVNSQVMKDFGSYLVGVGKNSLTFGVDVFRSLESLEYDSQIRNGATQFVGADYIEYPETQFYYLKNNKGFFLATKGGYNAESHNHNDAGTFSLYYKETPIFIDAGVGTYTRQTFGPERYSIWTMRSPYHNLPSINGYEQRFGKKYKAGNITLNKKAKKIEINITDTYPKEANIQKWIRAYQLKDNELLVQDSFALSNQEEPNQTHFMLWGDIDDSKEGEIVININGVKMVMKYNPKLFSSDLETIQLEDPRLSKVWGNQIYRLTLTAKNKELNGQYQYRIYPLN